METSSGDPRPVGTARTRPAQARMPRVPRGANAASRAPEVRSCLRAHRNTWHNIIHPISACPSHLADVRAYGHVGAVSCRVRCMVPCRRAVPVRVVTPASRRRVFRVRGGNRRCVSTRTACGHGNSHGAWPHAPPGMPAPNGSNRVLTFTKQRSSGPSPRSLRPGATVDDGYVATTRRAGRARSRRAAVPSLACRSTRASRCTTAGQRGLARPRRGPAGRRTHGGHGAALAARMILHGVWRGKHDERSICPANPANPEPARAAAHQSSPVPGLRSGARSRTSRAKG